MLAVPDEQQPAPDAGQYWQRVELFRRLEHVVRTTSLAEVCAKVGISRATAYRWFWGERSPSLDNLRAIHLAYPKIFPELELLLEDK